MSSSTGWYKRIQQEMHDQFDLGPIPTDLLHSFRVKKTDLENTKKMLEDEDEFIKKAKSVKMFHTFGVYIFSTHLECGLHLPSSFRV
jgi:hypothetical protein